MLRILGREAQAGHHGHVLNLELVAVIWALAVIEIELEREALLFVIFWTDVFLFVGTIGAGAFARVVQPTHEGVVVVFFTDTVGVFSKSSPLDFNAFAGGMAGEASCGFAKSVF